MIFLAALANIIVVLNWYWHLMVWMQISVTSVSLEIAIIEQNTFLLHWYDCSFVFVKIFFKKFIRLFVCVCVCKLW